MQIRDMTTMDDDLRVMLVHMQPVLNPGDFAYCSVPIDFNWQHLAPIACMRETEGWTLVLPIELALELKLKIYFECAWITLNLQTSLSAFGLTATFSKALSDVKIGCNVIAGTFHDHIFVPIEAKVEALSALQQLSNRAAHRQVL
jgi:uncharacterized protein